MEKLRQMKMYAQKNTNIGYDRYLNLHVNKTTKIETQNPGSKNAADVKKPIVQKRLPKNQCK